MTDKTICLACTLLLILLSSAAILGVLGVIFWAGQENGRHLDYMSMSDVTNAERARCVRDHANCDGIDRIRDGLNNIRFGAAQ